MTNQLFRRIRTPVQLRKDVLEASKDIIQNLKSYQRLLDIKELKAEKLKELKAEIKEIHLFMDNLRDRFPTELLRQYEEHVRTKPKTGSKKGKTKHEKPRKVVEASELAKLENKLADIENKLKTLS